MQRSIVWVCACLIVGVLPPPDTPDIVVGRGARISASDTTLEGRVTGEVAQEPQRASTTWWDGVYTDAQASRGRDLYIKSCAYCHRHDLMGGEDLPVVPPSLVALPFLESWTGATIGELYGFISATMPWRRPNLEDPQAYIDIVAYILKENEVPSGSVELLADPTILEQILITDERPDKSDASLIAPDESPAMASTRNAPAQIARSVLDGVYTPAQAQRGETIYLLWCTSCHSESLVGVDSTPPLVGDTFLSALAGQTVAQVFDKIRMSMPQDAPGRLTRQQYADVLSYILSVNEFPPGASDLPHDPELLKHLSFDMDVR